MFCVTRQIITDDLRLVQQKSKSLVASVQRRFNDVIQIPHSIEFISDGSSKTESDVFVLHCEHLSTYIKGIGYTGADSTRSRHAPLRGPRGLRDQAAERLFTVVPRLDLLTHDGPALVPCNTFELFQEHGLSHTAQASQPHVRWNLRGAAEHLREP